MSGGRESKDPGEISSFWIFIIGIVGVIALSVLAGRLDRYHAERYAQATAEALEMRENMDSCISEESREPDGHQNTNHSSTNGGVSESCGVLILDIATPAPFATPSPPGSE